MTRLLLLALLLAGCASSLPTATCGLCGPAGVQPPAPALVTEAMLDGRAQALSTCPGVVSHAVPDVSWQRCQFMVEDGVSTPGGPPHKVCAAGATYKDRNLIWISLAEPERVLPLVTWETRNYYWSISGCGGQAF